MKKDTIIAIIVLAIALILLAWIFPAHGQSSPNFWLLSGSNLKPISASWNIQGNAFDPGGNKYVTSTTGGTASTTPWTLQNLVVASGTGVATINATSGTYYNTSNPSGFISTSTNNFGGLTNASITATLPITWSAGSVIACPTCGDVNGTGTANYLPLWKGATTLGTSSITSDNTSTTVNNAFQVAGADSAGNSMTGYNHFFQLGTSPGDGNTGLTFQDATLLNTNIQFFSSSTATGTNGFDIAVSPGNISSYAVLRTDNVTANHIFEFPDAAGTFALGTGTSALTLWNASGTLTAYGGASACTSGQAVTTISAVGGTTCAAFLTSAPATTTFNGVQSATFNYNVVSGNSLATTSVATSGGNSTTTITLNATLASSTLGPANYFDATTTSPYNQFTISGNDFKVTIAKFSCDTTNGTTTYHLIRATSTLNATGQAVADITCGATENDITSFTTSTLDAGTYLRAIVSSTTATPPSLDTLWGHGTKS